MGPAIRIIATCAISLIVTSCGIMETFGTSADNHASITIKLSTNTTQTPDHVVVNVSANNYNKSKEAPYHQTEGVIFNDIPLGNAEIHVEAKWGDITFLDGHSGVDLHSGHNQVHVPLNNLLIAYTISPDHEGKFDKNIDAKTPFWDILSGRNHATLEKFGSANAIVTAALGDDALYFLVSLNDDNFISENETAGPFGEWINDAFILYFCVNSTYQYEFYRSPCFRIQCQMGNTDPNQGKLHLKNFNTSPQVDIINTIVDFQEIEAKIIAIAGNTRLLEIRIPKDKIGIGGIGKTGDRFAVAIRYNNVVNQNQTDGDKIDWKSFVTNPLEKSDPWGNLEFQ